MDGNTLIEVIKGGLSLVNSSISAVVGAVITTLFLRKNTDTTEFEKVKAGKFGEVIDQLLKSGKMSYFEYYKCKNYLDIAKKARPLNFLCKFSHWCQNSTYLHKNLSGLKKADEYLSEIEGDDETSQNRHTKFNFDWLIRFFDAAGNISNEEMKTLWASVLAGEVYKSGSFSLRTIDTLYNMTPFEAELFSDISKIVLDDSMLFSSMGEVGQDVNEQYRFDNDSLRLLEECGLINGLKMQSQLELLPGESGGFTCGNNLLLFSSLSDEGVVVNYNCYNLTMVGQQLYSVVYSGSDENYLRELGRKIRESNTFLKVSMHPMTEEDGDRISYDSEIDLLGD